MSVKCAVFTDHPEVIHLFVDSGYNSLTFALTVA